MTTIKKGFIGVYDILIDNKDKKVKDIMNLILPIMTSQQRDKNHFEDEHGLWVFCYYHKEWELVSQVEYGSKVNTSTGLNSMCKVGTNQWTRQQREFKKAKADLLNEVADGNIQVEDLQEKIEEFENQKDRIVSLMDHYNILAYQELEEAEED